MKEREKHIVSGGERAEALRDIAAFYREQKDAGQYPIPDDHFDPHDLTEEDVGIWRAVEEDRISVEELHAWRGKVNLEERKGREHDDVFTSRQIFAALAGTALMNRRIEQARKRAEKRPEKEAA